MLQKVSCMNKEIKAGEFKAVCLRLMDEIFETKSEVIITKRKVPIAKLVAVDREEKRLFGALKGTVKICKEIVEPVGEEWDACQ